MSNQLMNPDFANHFVALLSCILTNRTKFTYINQTMYQLVCKLFIFSFSCLQTIYLGFFDFENNFFQDFSSPPPPKNNGPSLRQAKFAFTRSREQTRPCSADLALAYVTELRATSNENFYKCTSLVTFLCCNL